MITMRKWQSMHAEIESLKSELSELKASLPKVRADAITELFERIGTDRVIEGVSWTVVFDIDAMEYVDKLEAGNE